MTILVTLLHFGAIVSDGDDGTNHDFVRLELEAIFASRMETLTVLIENNEVSIDILNRHGRSMKVVHHTLRSSRW